MTRLRRSVAWIIPLLGLTPGSAVAAPLRTVTVEAHRAQLRQAETTLRQMEDRPHRPLNTILQRLAKAQQVRRADGQRFTASDDEWTRRLNDVTPNATRQEVRAVRQAVAVRLRALDEWSPTRDHYYEPAADAQSIMRQLEQTGQIRTGPTATQKMWASIIKWSKDLANRFLKWLSGLFPTGSGRTPVPLHIDPTLIWILFTATVVALLCVIGFFVWRAVGGRLGRRGARREVRYLEGEDVELLKLPPDELAERVRQFAGAGNYREALRHLYIALLLRLDARGVWRYDTRRTNWEHVAGLRQDAARAPLVAPLSDITRRFDRVRYGNANCTADGWTRFERDVEQLQNSSAAAQSAPRATASRRDSAHPSPAGAPS